MAELYRYNKDHDGFETNMQDSDIFPVDAVLSNMHHTTSNTLRDYLHVLYKSKIRDMHVGAFGTLSNEFMPNMMQFLYSHNRELADSERTKTASNDASYNIF